MSDYLGLVVTIGIFAAIFVVRMVITSMDKKPVINDDIPTTALCPFCRVDLTDHLKRVARGSRSHDVVATCPSCEMKAQWNVAGFPPIMMKKISRPKATADGDKTAYDKAE